eukprot:TRINITY_DN7081_c0_g1_i1.p1 TRINITY_DN7081_c0_g1~~TRINITY_DN7081_c0_g1_i1.p1  ORF type:complete len:637 (+),score=113.35 TRINITY_DN7081_c0_g1_i1:127-2037(+)
MAGGKKRNNRSDNERTRPKSKSSGANQFIGFIVFVILGIAVHQHYNPGGVSRKEPSESRVEPTVRPMVERPWSVMGEDSESKSDQLWVKKMPGSFKSRVWLSSHEEHPNPNIRELPSGSLGKWSSENSPGHMGTGVELGFLNKKARDAREKMYNQHYFDEFISELVPLDRKLPDWRGQWCRDTYDKDIESLEPTTIIICFYNEARSTLLRSIHSVINSTPRSLLKEILILDDYSSLEHLGKDLDDYIQKHFDGLVRVIHLKKRHGLMRCRMVGIQESKGSILTFLDSHIEAGKGWLEPLLHGIKENPKLITSPVIDSINDTTFYYTFIHKDLYGLMNWNLDFEWRELSAGESAKKENLWAPHANPIMAGGLFSIRKDWFKSLGFYDEDMSIWGGENYELSFKAWMCGGTIEIAPCSRVGHVFRTKSPYRVTPEDVHKNGIRVAKVWMDEFQYLHYERLGHFDKKGDARLIEYGDVNKRQELRDNLGCNSFKWFLDNVAKSELPYHDLIGSGEIKNPASGLCLDKNDRTEFMGQPVDLMSCHNFGGHQYWMMNRNRFILRDYTCLGVQNSIVIIAHCQMAGTWNYDANKKSLRHSSGQCMTVSGNLAIVSPCSQSDPNQIWELTRYDRLGLKYKNLF